MRNFRSLGVLPYFYFGPLLDLDDSYSWTNGPILWRLPFASNSHFPEVFEDFPSLKEMEELLGGEPQVLRDLAGWVAQQVAVDRCHVEAALHLLQDGASVHFIASYRKEMTGCMKEQKLHDIEREMNRGLALETRRRRVALELQSRGQLTEQRKKDLLEAGTAEDLDDIWAPFQHAEGASMDLGMGPQLCGPVTAFISALWCIAE